MSYPAATAVRVSKKQDQALLGDVVEREIPADVEASQDLEFIKHKGGFPQANRRHLSRTPSSQVGLGYVREVEGGKAGVKLKPETLQKLQSRAKARAEVDQREEESPIAKLRFELDGTPVGWLSESEMEVSLEERALRRDPIRQSEGSVRSVGEYTLVEALALYRSAVHGQKLAGLDLIANVVQSCWVQPGGLPGGVSWMSVLDFVVVNLGVVSVTRTAMKDTSVGVRSKAVRILERLLVDRSARRCPILGYPRLQVSQIKFDEASARWIGVGELARDVIKDEVESGLLFDLRSVVIGKLEMRRSVLSILKGLAAISREVSDLVLIHYKVLASIVGIEMSGSDEMGLFIDCMCGLVESSPNAPSVLESTGWLDVLRVELTSWMSISVPADRDLGVLAAAFRLCRLLRLRQAEVFRLDDLFSVYYPLMGEFQGDDRWIDVTTEALWWIATCVESTEVAGIPLGCLEAIVESVSKLVGAVSGGLEDDLREGRGLDWMSAALTAISVICSAVPSLKSESVSRAVFSLGLDSLIEDWSKVDPPFGLSRPKLTLSLVYLRWTDQVSIEVLKAAVETAAIMRSMSEASEEAEEKLASWCCAVNFADLLFQKPRCDEGTQIHLGLRLAAQLPPSFDSTLINILTRSLTPGKISAAAESTPELLPILKTPIDARSIANKLKEALMCTWSDPNKRQDHSSRQLINLLKPLDLLDPTTSNLPLPRDYLLLPLRKPDESDHTYGHQISRDQFLLLVSSELSESSALHDLPPDLKLRRTTELLLNGDAWQDSFVQDCFLSLAETYSKADNLTALGEDLAERLADCFVSSGDSFIGRVLPLMLLKNVPVQSKITLWRKLDENYLLHLIPPMPHWIGPRAAYTPYHPPPNLRSLISTSLETGHLDKAERLNSGLFEWTKSVLKI